MKKQLWLIGCLTGMLLLTACQGQSFDRSVRDGETETVEITEASADAENGATETMVVDEPEAEKRPEELYKSARLDADTAVIFSLESGFYADDQRLVLETDDGGVIFYSDDGSSPSYRSIRYDRPIPMTAVDTEFPNCYVIRAIAYYPDGTRSPVDTRSFFMSAGIHERFSTPVFSLIGDPDDLTLVPDGLLFGDNALKRGDETEREIYVQAFTEKGELLLSQEAGIRVFGNASRKYALKSFKLYARKEYSAEQKTFPFGLFGTVDREGALIDSYKRLVLHNAGNDYNFAYLRDEFAQRLAKEAGFSDYEAVMPVVTYLNGEYYTLHWLHENYCDKYFQNKYGKSPGEYVVIEGSELFKAHTSPNDAEYEPLAEQFQKTYKDLSVLDMNVDENYQRVRAFVDVENYLDYFAFNIYINNADWPQGNEKVYAYLPTADETDLIGVKDGRWRFLPHDMDFSLDIYGDNPLDDPGTDNLAMLLTDDRAEKTTDFRFAPLFAALMERPDCRKYFTDKMHELMDGVFYPDTMLAILDEINAERKDEQPHSLKRIRAAVPRREFAASEESTERSLERIRAFIRERPAYMERFLIQDLP